MGFYIQIQFNVMVLKTHSKLPKTAISVFDGRRSSAFDHYIFGTFRNNAIGAGTREAGGATTKLLGSN